MTDIERKAHDIALAVATCKEQAKQNVAAAAISKSENIRVTVHVDADKFIETYKDAYKKAIAAFQE